jgi:hypothetical protein
MGLVDVVVDPFVGFRPLLASSCCSARAIFRTS